MMIALLGPSGFAGSAILKEALDRGHQVTAVVRNQGQLTPSAALSHQVADVYDSAALSAVIAGHVAQAAKSAPVKRLLWVGSAGGL